MILISVICIFAVLLCLFFRKYIQYRTGIDRIPGPKVDTILLGNLRIFIKPRNVSKNDFFRLFHRRFGNIIHQFRSNGLCRLWFGPYHVIYLLTNAEFVECLLKSQKNINRGLEYKMYTPLFGDGLMLSEANIWRARRKMLNPAFHVKMLHNFIPIFSSHTEKLLKSIDTAATTNGLNNGQTAVVKDVRKMFENFALNIIKETAMGINPDGDTELDSQAYHEAMKNIFRAIINRFQNPVHWICWIYAITKAGKSFQKNIAILQEHTKKAIQRQIGQFHIKFSTEENCDKTAKPKPSIYMDILLENYFKINQKFNKIINPKMLESEVTTLIVSGHETVSIAMTFTLLMIGWYGDVQDRVQDELKAIFRENALKDMDIEDLRQMHYLEMCIKETLRLYPSGQIIGRQLSEALQFPNGVTLPAGSSCYMPIIYLHKDPKHFPEPNKFKPERFEAPFSPFVYIPFSSGPRNCIGQKYAMLELKFVLAQIFRKYRVHSRTDPQNIVLGMAPVLKPLTEIEVHFESI